MTLSAVLQIVGSECSKRQQCDFKCTSLRPNGFRENKVKMFTPRKCGVKFDPPTLVVYYEVKRTGMCRDILVRITCYNSPFNPSDLVELILSDRNWNLHHVSQKHMVKLIVLICLVFNKS